MRISDVGLKSLAALENLRSLYLNRTQVTDSGLMHLQGLSRLQQLTLENTRVTKKESPRCKSICPTAPFGFRPGSSRAATARPGNHFSQEGVVLRSCNNMHLIVDVITVDCLALAGLDRFFGRPPPKSLAAVASPLCLGLSCGGIVGATNAAMRRLFPHARNDSGRSVASLNPLKRGARRPVRGGLRRRAEGVPRHAAHVRRQPALHRATRLPALPGRAC